MVAARWCPDGTRLLATASMDGTARLWEFEEREEAPGRWASRCTHTLEGHAAPLTDLVFDRCGGVLVREGAMQPPRAWDVFCPRAARRMYAHVPLGRELGLEWCPISSHMHGVSVRPSVEPMKMRWMRIIQQSPAQPDRSSLQLVLTDV